MGRIEKNVSVLREMIARGVIRPEMLKSEALVAVARALAQEERENAAVGSDVIQVQLTQLREGRRGNKQVLATLAELVRRRIQGDEPVV